MELGLNLFLVLRFPGVTISRLKGSRQDQESEKAVREAKIGNE